MEVLGAEDGNGGRIQTAVAGRQELNPLSSLQPHPIRPCTLCEGSERAGVKVWKTGEHTCRGQVGEVDLGGAVVLVLEEQPRPFCLYPRSVCWGTLLSFENS